MSSLAGLVLGSLLRLRALLLGTVLGLTSGIFCLFLLLISHVLGLLCLLLRKGHGSAGLFVGEAGSLTVFLGSVVGTLLLLLTEERTQPGESVAGDDQAGGDHGLATSDISIATALLVLASVGIEDVVLAITDDAEGEVGEVKDGTLDLLGVLLHNGEFGVDLGEAVGGEGVGLGDVGGYIAVWTLCVGDEGGNELLVAGVGEVEGLLAIGIGLEGRD